MRNNKSLFANIDWPLVNGQAPSLSAKDADAVSFAEIFKFA